MRLMTVGIRHDDLRKRNRAMVIAAVRREGRPSRTEIARVTRLSHSTISSIAADMIDEGILIEIRAAEASAARRGRPQVGIGLNPEAATVATLTLSLNCISASLVDYAGGTIAQQSRRLPTLEMDSDALVRAVVETLRALVARAGGETPPVQRLTLAVQGITDSRARNLLWSPITPHSDIPFADALEQAFGIPATVHNDCNMIAVALGWRYPERFRDDFVAILLSDGIGMGLMLRGKLFIGTHSSAGEFGHMVHMPNGALCRCGRLGCIEAYAGNYAILRKAKGGDERARPEADIEPGVMTQLAEAARRGDGIERAAFHAAGRAIGFGIGSLFSLIDPAPVAIVGQGASAFDILEPAVRDAIAQTAGGQHSTAISFETEPDEVPLIRDGAAMTALRSLDEEIFGPGSADSRPLGREVA
jgi:predicted NBD/HSP70 family sugar kinase